MSKPLKSAWSVRLTLVAIAALSALILVVYQTGADKTSHDRSGVPEKIRLVAKTSPPLAVPEIDAPAHPSPAVKQDVTPEKPPPESLPEEIRTIKILRTEAKTSQFIEFLKLKKIDRLLTPDEKQTIERMVATAPLSALAWATSIEPNEDYGRLYTSVLTAWSESNFDSAWSWAASQNDDMASLVVLASAKDNLAAAAIASNWVEQLPDESLLRYGSLSQIWRQLNQTKANLVLADSLNPGLREIMLQTALTDYAKINPLDAFNYALLKTDKTEREITELAVVSGWPTEKLDELRTLLPRLTYDAAKELALYKLKPRIPPALAR